MPARPLDWIAVDLASGRVIDDLPNLEVTSDSLAVTIGRYEAATVKLPLDDPPAAWEAVCNPYTSALIALDQDSNPLWGGIVDFASEVASASDPDAVDLRLVTCEGYFDRRYVGDRAFTGVGQNAIAANLLASYVLAGPGIAGRIADGTGGTTRDRTYLDADDRSVYSALQDLMADLGGLEWTVGWEWQHAPERITPVITLGSPLLGTAPLPGEQPNATFSLPGPVTEATRVRDFSGGKGAGRVRAYGSSPAGGGRLQREVTAVNLLGRPLVETRFTPSTSITDAATLQRYATQASAALVDGSQALVLKASVEDADRLGVDWNLGDTIGYDLTSAAWPRGLRGTGRCIGWQYDPNGVWVAPVLA